MPTLAYIYSLTDPRDNSVRYVGMTQNWPHRPLTHKTDKYASPAKRKWLDELAREDAEPKIGLLETVVSDERFDKERAWIKRLTEQGSDLVNVVHNRPLSDASVRIIVDVAPDFHKKVKQAALDRDQTIRELVLNCLETCMSNEPVERLAQPAPAKADTPKE